MLSTVLWYLAISLLGLLAFPLAYRLLPGLPDRGYAFARSLGLLMWGFVFWLLGSYGVIGNNLAGLLLALAGLAGLGYWAYSGIGVEDLKRWWRNNRRYVIGVEALFALALVLMVLMRATHPDALYTEKPFELAFINSIMASPSMPPLDPWLSGYSISYYYFGFLMVSMLSMVTGVSGAVGFNLGLALVFALAASSAYGLAYNLLALRYPAKGRQNGWLAGLAPVFVLLFGNLQALLEVLHARHLFWTAGADGVMQSRFWSWLNIDDLVFPPFEAPSWTPRFYPQGFFGRWWWWRSSRVINDLNFLGGDQELIDEFPAFSFTLGDLHPHVFSLAFVFLVMALALNLYRRRREDSQTFLRLHISPANFALSAVVLGALAFINIWDFPIYLMLFAGAYLLQRVNHEGWAWRRVGDFVDMLLALGMAGLLAYLPFFLGFSSQAGGVLPNLINPTRGAHLWVMFGTLLPFIFIYLFHQRGAEWGARLARGLGLAVGLVALLWLFTSGGAYLASRLPALDIGGILGRIGAPDVATLMAEATNRRLAAIGGLLTLVALLGLLITHFWPARSTAQPAEADAQQSHRFALLLGVIATLLVIAPEFIYLLDHFGTRMNTVFKFYYQAWAMLAILAAYGAAVLLVDLRRMASWLFTFAFVVLMAVGLLYPVFAFTDVSTQPLGQPLSLDGQRYLSEGQREAVDWLNQAPHGVLAEAVGGQYSAFARYATASAQVGVLGWPGHEGQWRGDSVNYHPRVSDMEVLYSTLNWSLARDVILRYGIDYIVVGDLERSQYQVQAEKFDTYLEVAFQNAEVTIYRVP